MGKQYKPPSQEDLIRDILKKTTQVTDALTTEEWRVKFGCGIGSMRKTIRKLIDAGKFEMVRIQHVGIDGQCHWVPAYRAKGKS